jgi:hypothetical protein
MFPKSSMSGAGYYLHVSNGGVSGDVFPKGKHVLFFGKASLLADGILGAPDYPAITATEAMSSDTKVDDGLPYSGVYRIRANNARTCVVGAYAGGANAAQVASNQYNYKVSGNLCALAINIQ